jgi:hypothetical protein
MPKFGNIRIRRRQLRKGVWIAISVFASLAMIISAVAPALQF